MDTRFEAMAIYRELANRAANKDAVADELLARLKIAIPVINRTLNDIRIFFRHYTDHTITHSLRIIQNYEYLIEEQHLYNTGRTSDSALSSVDLFLLIASALTHDIGMVIKESEINSLMADPDFPSHVEQWIETNPDTANNDWYRKGIPRLAVADFVRKKHQRRSLSMILDPGFENFQLAGPGSDISQWLGQISAGHGMDYVDVIDPDKFPVRTRVRLESGVYQECNPRFVALCLRLGDLLDIGTARTCPILRHLSEPLPVLSRHHWDQYSSIRIDRDLNNQIKVTGTSPNQDAERVLRDWCTWLRTEALQSVMSQNREKPCYRISLGGVDYQVKPMINKFGKPAYEFLNLKFNLDEKIVFERLFGKSLYGRPELAFREVLQNAIDAQRTLLAYNLSKTSQWQSGNETLRSRMLSEEIESQRARMPIIVQIEERQPGPSSRKELWVTFTDVGIGMSRSVLEQYFLKVGRSRWGEDSSIKKFGIGSYTIGTFGVGVLATLMIADRVVVTTKSCLPDEKGICATIYGWQGYLGTEEANDAAVGTSISLRLIDQSYLNMDKLADSISHIAPNVDFDIIIRSQGKSDISIVPFFSTAKKDKRRSDISILPFRTTGSQVAICVGHLLKRGVVLCQDGINVDQVVFPLGATPPEVVLRNYHASLDLRGLDRVPLDLSRNLPESGYQKFWEEFVPRIWESIAAAFPLDLNIQKCLADLIDYEILSDREDPLRFIVPKKGMLLKPPSPSDFEFICTLNPLSNTAQVDSLINRRGSVLFWLTPRPDLHYAANLSHLLTIEDPDETQYYWKTKVRYAGPGSEPDDEDDDVDDDNGISTDIWQDRFDRGYEVDEFDPQVDQKRRWFTQRLDQEWKAIIDKYPHILPTDMYEFGATLTSKETMATIPISGLIGFQLNENWICLREPSRGQFRLIPVPIDDVFTEYALRVKLDLASYYLCLMWLYYRTSLNDWGSFDTGNFGAHFGDVADVIAATVKEEVDDETYDDEYEYDKNKESKDVLLDDFSRVVDALLEQRAGKVFNSNVLQWESKAWIERQTVPQVRPKKRPKK